jgi:inorganic pyrophosphatase
VQTEKDGKSMRNDRLIAAAKESHRYGDFKTIKDLDKYLLKEIINFFVTYNKMSKKKFKVLDTNGPHTAISLIKKHIE